MSSLSNCVEKPRQYKRKTRPSNRAHQQAERRKNNARFTSIKTPRAIKQLSEKLQARSHFKMDATVLEPLESLYPKIDSEASAFIKAMDQLCTNDTSMGESLKSGNLNTKNEHGFTQGEVDCKELIMLLLHLGFKASDDSFLDIGSGLGNLVGTIASVFHCTSIGIEFQKNLVDWSKRMLKKLKVPKSAQIYCFGASQKSRELDAIYSRSSFVVWNCIVWTDYSVLQALAKLEKKLMPNAWLIVSRQISNLATNFEFKGAYNLKPSWSNRRSTFYVYKKL